MLHDKEVDAFSPLGRIGVSSDGCKMTNRSVGDEGLRTIDPVTLSLLDRRRPKSGSIRSGVGFRQGKG